MDQETDRAGKWLLVDVSNQQTKWVTCFEGELGEVRTVMTKDVAHIFEVVGAEYAGVVMASVVPKVAVAIEGRCNAWGIPVLRATCAFLQAKGLMDFSDYEGQRTIGEDRLANILGAAENAASDHVMTVDLGTATTIEVATRDGNKWKFSGGMIAPGVNALAVYMHEKTAQLPMINPASIDESTVALGQTTRDSMSGALKFGYPAMVAGMVNAAVNECSGSTEVVVTGGAADFFPWQDFPEAKRDELLTLRGLARLIEIG